MNVNPLNPRVTAYLFLLARLWFLPGLWKETEKTATQATSISSPIEISMHTDQLWDLVKQSPQGKLFRSFIKSSQWECRIGQSHDFWRADSLFVARVASFAFERNEGAKDATRDTNKLYARQKSCDYHYYQYKWPHRTNYFMRTDCLTWNHVAGCKFHLQPALCHLAREKERFRKGSLSFGHV